MKKYLILLGIFILISGCCKAPQPKKILLAKVNNYEITLEEFESEFRESPYSRLDTPESRKQFLDLLINRKLMLQDAQAKNLDKDNAFLKMIERFWEQSLLKLTLDRKTKEIAGLATVSDREIEEAYKKLAKEGKADKPYAQAYAQIKWELINQKETQMINDWVNGLHKKAKITLNYDLLNHKK